MLGSLFRGEKSSFAEYDSSSCRVTWTYEKADKIYCRALIKWLRFCYGEDETFSIDECPAALASLLHLQLNCMSLTVDIERHMVNTAERDMNIGVKLLVDCAVTYKECFTTEANRVDLSLAKSLFTHENISNYPLLLIDECLLKLPVQFLDVAELGKGSVENSMFHVRVKYVKSHATTLSEEEKCRVLEPCRYTELNSDQLKELSNLGVLSNERLTQLSLEELKTREEELNKARTMSEENRKRSDDMEKVMEDERKVKEQIIQERDAEVEAKEKVMKELEELRKIVEHWKPYMEEKEQEELKKNQRLHSS